ncbi:amino acid ABC transporter ATP-binding/permease protein [Streptomyces sp. NPDC052773]|uniref:amino acid ABC transporter ATP-binding/permease protein n=1 Tax=Streptomyces sp. NPDC052773 TaxID=3365693 RepID=UPI0037D27240
MRALFSVLRTAGPLRRLLPAAALALAADLAGVALMALAAWLIARAAQQPPMGALSVTIVAVRALAVTRGLFRYGERLAGHDAALRAVARLRARVFGALARRPAHEDARTVRDADAASRLVADVDLVQDALLRVALPVLSASAVSVAAVACTALVSPPAALVLALGLVCGGLLLPALTAAASARAARRGAALRAELAVRTVDLLDGAADLRVYGAAERETARAVDTARRLRAHDRGPALLSVLAGAALTVLQGATTVAVAVVCAGSTPAVWTVTLPLLTLAVFEALAPLPAAAQHLTTLPTGARRVHALLNPPATDTQQATVRHPGPRTTESPAVAAAAGTVPGAAAGAAPGVGAGTVPGAAAGAAPAVGAGTVPGAAAGAVSSTAAGVGPGVGAGTVPGAAAGAVSSTAAGAGLAVGAGTVSAVAIGTVSAAATGAGPGADAVHLSVRDLHVRHRPGGPFAVRGVDLELPPGRRVAVIGASGAGKSTLLAAIARFVVPERGGILLGGADLGRVPEAELRRTVSGALQDAHVFHTSVRNNLLPARPGATDEQLHDALRRAGLLDWVLSLPERLETVVGSDGDRLSGGQRRRLVLARALLAAPPVLLLDEPTEGLDPATADAVLADVLAAGRGSSLLLVTHRTAGLEAMDEVLVMDGGRIVRRGAPRAVLGLPATDPGEPEPEPEPLTVPV